MTLTRKGTRAAAAATPEDFIQYDHEQVTNREEEKEDDENPDREKHERDIVERISQPLKPPSINKDEEDEGQEEDVGATLASTEDTPPVDKDDEGNEDNKEDDYEDTVLSDYEDTKEETSSGHEGKLPSLYLLESSDDKYEDDDGTGAEDNNCDRNGNGDSGCTRNIGA